MNKFFAFTFLALCAVANSQVLPMGLPLNVYQTDLIASQIGGGSSSSSSAAAAASSSSAANNDLIASRINALNAWPLGLGSVGQVVGPIGPVVGPIGPLGPIVQQGGSSSSSAAAAAAASSSAANNALNTWPVLSGLGPLNPWISLPVGPVGPVGPIGPVNPLTGLVGIY